MQFSTIIGFSAAVCTTLAFVPQVIKAIKTKQTKDISLLMYSIMITGLILWLSYGLILNDAPIIAANTVSLALNMIVFGLKLKYK